MKDSVADYVRKCEVCRKTKPQNFVTQPPMGKFSDPKAIFRHVSTDIVGPIVMSNNKNRFLLVAVCSMSKFVVMRAVRDATAKSVIEFLRDEVFLKFCTPQTVLSDNGVQYKSKEYQKFLENHGTVAEYTANYHPQANPTEAANKSVVYAIKSYIENELAHRDWDLHIREVANAMNNSKHTSTSQVPSIVVYGQIMPQHGHEYTDFVDANQAFSRSQKTFETMRAKVRECLQKSYERSKKTYDLRSRQINYKSGDVVYRKNMKLSNAANYYSAKLAPRNVRCRIVEQTGSNTYRLRDENTGKEGIFSAKDFFKMYDR